MKGSIRVSAKTVDDAITEALIQLSVTSDRLEYEVIEKGSPGFLGIGMKQAVIEAWKKPEPEPEIDLSDPEPFIEKLKEEISSFDSSSSRDNYDDKKLNVYMFWGDGSEQSEQMIEFLNSLDSTYDRYFDLYTLEVWYDEDNRNLQQELLTQIGEDTNGVPCLIIGDQAFFGYDETLEEDIKAAIKEEYLKVPQYDAYKTYTS